MGLHIIVGLGITGFAVAKHLLRLGVPIAVVDTRAEPPFLSALRELAPDVPIYLGDFDKNILRQAARLIVSPGLTIKTGILSELVAEGIPMCGEIELFAESVPRGSIIAITGSNGKSTVTTLTAEMLQHAGKRVAVGGNLGTPALDLINPEIDYYVLELSSFQLETVTKLHPSISTILNICDDHLDRYENLSDYVSAKQRIYQDTALCLMNRQDILTKPHNARPVISFGSDLPLSADDFGLLAENGLTYLMKGCRKLCATNTIRVVGKHNWLNALASLALVDAVGVSLEDACEVLKTFPGLPHRCQFVRRVRGVDWYNDSKATNVGACLAAISGLSADCENKIILLAGGQGKNADFSPLRSVLRNCVREVILYGEDADKIAAVLDPAQPVLRADNFQQAIALAYSAQQTGDRVLLAPACASYDMFQNYIDRGERFCEYVGALSE